MSETDGLLTTTAAAASADEQHGATPALPSVWRVIRRGGVITDIEGSAARDHLANERTYLAWIRTALSLTGVGIGLLKIHDFSKTTGYLVIVLGVFTLMNATWRYLHVMRLVANRQFQPNVFSSLLLVAIMLVAIFALLGLHVVGRL